jgi:hypothetical protein
MEHDTIAETTKQVSTVLQTGAGNNLATLHKIQIKEDV